MRYHVGIGCSFGASAHNVHGIIAKKLNATLINLSEPGQGNYRIQTELLYWISTNQEKLEHTTFSIGWSGIYRNDVIEDTKQNNRAFQWTRWWADRDDPTLKNLPKKMDITLDHAVRFLVNVLAVQNLIKNKGCRYVMYNGIDTYVGGSMFDIETALRIKILEKQIDKKHYFRFSSSQSKFVADNKYFLNPEPASLIEKIINWPTDDIQYPVKDAHPSAEGDEKWAELLWKFCQDNQIL